MVALAEAAERPSMRVRFTWNEALRLADIAAPQAPALLCCGQWHAIQTIPFTAPCCGHIYFTELAEHQAKEGHICGDVR